MFSTFKLKHAGSSPHIHASGHVLCRPGSTFGLEQVTQRIYETARKAQSEHYTRSTSHWTMHASTVFEERTKLQSSINEVAAAGRIFNADRFD